MAETLSRKNNTKLQLMTVCNALVGSFSSASDSQIAGVVGKTSFSQDEARAQSGNLGFDEKEVGKFSALASSWWDPSGPMAPLHSMNPIRVQFTRRALCRRFQKDEFSPRPFHGLRMLDIGSGAGILSESLARLGADVIGVDASKEAVHAAKAHAEADQSISSSIHYRQGTAEQLASEGQVHDIVVASEVIEHIPDPEGFCAALTSLTQPHGVVLISTLNRTPRSYGLAILAAERLLGALPPGTHNWSNFITPDELVMLMDYQGMRLFDIQGMAFSPLSQQWSLSSDLAVNYIAAFVKA